MSSRTKELIYSSQVAFAEPQNGVDRFKLQSSEFRLLRWEWSDGLLVGEWMSRIRSARGPRADGHGHGDKEGKVITISRWSAWLSSSRGLI